MKHLKLIILIISLMILAACGSTPQAPTAAPSLTPFTTPQPQPTRTALSNTMIVTITPLFNNQANQVAPTAFIPATFTPVQQSVADSNGTLLTNGQGLTNGAGVTNGEFQVEGYCTLLNTSYGVSEDGNNWYCTFNGQSALQLRQQNFNEICQRTYNNTLAIAIQINNGARPAYQWRCYQPAILPTPTSAAPPQLLNNGRGMTTGSLMNNGEVEVEGYCSAINQSYGVDVDQNFWYCTQNNNRILTLGIAEFDDICIRTYSNPAAFAQQINNGDRPAFQWRCLVIPN
ncbi:MAG: hypothetical protein WBC91_12805 [Phototrophicaceae bacterium]